MDKKHLEEAFEKMGAEIEIQDMPDIFGGTRRGVRPLNANVGHRVTVIDRPRHDEFFSLSLADGVSAQVIDVQPDDKHLLLLVKDATPRKYLMGHDERHWFVAGVPETARTVTHAKELLQPPQVQEAVKKAQLAGDKKFSRHNKAFKRQGEWFFIPVDINVANRDILKNEPIRRGRSKPHVCEFIYRRGGQAVVVCSHFPNGISAETFERTKVGNSYTVHSSRCSGRTMVRDAEVYAKGKVTHPDHSTLVLKGWHRVFMSNEVFSQSMAFLD